MRGRPWTPGAAAALCTLLNAGVSLVATGTGKATTIACDGGSGPSPFRGLPGPVRRYWLTFVFLTREMRLRTMRKGSLLLNSR